MIQGAQLRQTYNGRLAYQGRFGRRPSFSAAVGWPTVTAHNEQHE